MKKRFVFALILTAASVFLLSFSSLAGCDMGQHAFQSISKTEPTCTENGSETFRCVLCGTEKTEIINAKGHSFSISAMIKEATCTESGSADSTCSECGLTTTVPIDPKGHSGEVSVLIMPTCTEKGREEGICSVCGEKYSNSTEALGHIFVFDHKKEASCAEDGYELYVCSVCGEEEKRNITEKHHDFETVEGKEATCEEKGFIRKVCKVCGEEFSQDIPPSGHDWNDGEAVREAGFFTKGSVKFICKRDSSHVLYEPIPSKFESDSMTKILCISLVGAIAVSALLTLFKALCMKKKRKQL